MTAPRIIRNHPAEQYHADPALSAGRVITAHQRSWMHAMQLGERKATPAMLEGSLLHCMVLEPGRVGARYAAIPHGLKLSTVDGRAWVENVTAAGLQAIPHDAWVRCGTMAFDLKLHPAVRPLLEAANDRELSLWWTDRITGIRLKARPDAISGRAVIDLKRSDASPDGFRRAAATYRHDMRAAWYLDGATACGLDVDRYVYIVVEPEPPHAVALYEIAEEDLDLARWRIDKLLEEYAEHQARGEWPGYPTEVQTIEMPPWARIRQEVMDVVEW